MQTYKEGHENLLTPHSATEHPPLVIPIVAMASALSLVAVAALAVVANSQSLQVVNKCSEDVFLFTQSSFGTIDNNVVVSAGATTNMGISSNWDGAVNVGM